MKRGVLVLSALLVILTGAALVHWMSGFGAILPWPILLIMLAVGAGGFVLTLLRDEVADHSEKSQTPPVEGKPATSRITKKHRPRARAKKRVIRNAFKRRRTLKAGPIVFSHDDQTAHPGDQQVGFFG